MKRFADMKNWMLVPILVLYMVFIVGGLLAVGVESFGMIPSIGLTDFSFHGYRAVLSHPSFTRNLLYSVYLAGVSATVSVLMGVALAYALVVVRNRFLKALTLRTLEFGLILPYLLAVFLAMLFLGQTGILARGGAALGILKDYRDFPVMIFDPLGIGIIWTFVFKGAPFIALFTYRVMERISGTYHEVASTLQAGEWAIFRRIYLPLSANTIIWSACVVLAYDLGSFEVPYLLNGLRPVPLSSQLYSAYVSPDLTTGVEAMALSLIILLTGILCVTAYGLLLKAVLRGTGRSGSGGAVNDAE